MQTLTSVIPSVLFQRGSGCISFPRREPARQWLCIFSTGRLHISSFINKLLMMHLCPRPQDLIPPEENPEPHRKRVARTPWNVSSVKIQPFEAQRGVSPSFGSPDTDGNYPAVPVHVFESLIRISSTHSASAVFCFLCLSRFVKTTITALLMSSTREPCRFVVVGRCR